MMNSANTRWIEKMEETLREQKYETLAALKLPARLDIAKQLDDEFGVTELQNQIDELKKRIDEIKDPVATGGFMSVGYFGKPEASVEKEWNKKFDALVKEKITDPTNEVEENYKEKRIKLLTASSMAEVREILGMIPF